MRRFTDARLAGRMRAGAPAAVAALLLLAPQVASPATSGGNPELGRAERFVNTRCPGPQREIVKDAWVPGRRFNALYGNCRAGDGRDQHVWFFADGRFIRSDTREPDSSKRIIELWDDSETIAFLYVLYGRDDANCCPTGGGRIVRFRIEGSHVRALDRLPARQLGTVPAGR
jgi:hypothetical protein